MLNPKTIFFISASVLILVGAGCVPAGEQVTINSPSAGNGVTSERGSTTAPGNKETKPAEDAVPSALADAVDANATDDNMNNEDTTSEQAAARPAAPTAPVGILPAERIEKKQVRIETSKGTIVFELYAKDAPKTVSNFVALAESGYFDGLTYHRVVPGFVIQGGDPTGTGRGGPGYKFEDEPVTREYLAGTVAMANSGPDTNGSQYFICIEDQPALPKNYTIFGQVTSGMDVVRKIAVSDVMRTVTVEPLK